MTAFTDQAWQRTAPLRAAIDALPFVFLGPLVGALSRSATGWVSDKWGGGRVTIWVFILMMIGCAGVGEMTSITALQTSMA